MQTTNEQQTSDLITLTPKTTPLKRQQVIDKVAYTLNIAVNVLNTIDAAQLVNRNLTPLQYKPLSIQYVEVESAYKHLLDTLQQASKSEWVAVVDTLTHCPTLDHDQLVQANKHAAEKRRLFQEYTFHTANQFGKLLPTLLDDSKNKPRTLARWVNESKVLAMKISGDWHYPVIQINDKGEFYQDLQKLISNAVYSGYSHWEIMSWLVSPTVYIDEEIPGTPLDNFDKLESLGEIMDAIKALPDDTQSPTSIMPLTMLQQGDQTKFEKVAYQWLKK